MAQAGARAEGLHAAGRGLWGRWTVRRSGIDIVCLYVLRERMHVRVNGGVVHAGPAVGRRQVA